MEETTFGWLLWFFCEFPSVPGMSASASATAKREKTRTTAIDHDTRKLPLFGYGGDSCLDVFLVVVGAFAATSEDDMDVLVSACFDDGGEALFGDAHEGVWV